MILASCLVLCSIFNVWQNVTIWQWLDRYCWTVNGIFYSWMSFTLFEETIRVTRPHCTEFETESQFLFPCTYTTSVLNLVPILNTAKMSSKKKETSLNPAFISVKEVYLVILCLLVPFWRDQFYFISSACEIRETRITYFVWWNNCARIFFRVLFVSRHTVPCKTETKDNFCQIVFVGANLL